MDSKIQLYSNHLACSIMLPGCTKSCSCYPDAGVTSGDASGALDQNMGAGSMLSYHFCCRTSKCRGLSFLPFPTLLFNPCVFSLAVLAAVSIIVFSQRNHEEDVREAHLCP